MQHDTKNRQQHTNQQPNEQYQYYLLARAAPAPPQPPLASPAQSGASSQQRAPLQQQQPATPLPVDKMNSPHHHRGHHDSDHDVHQQSLLWFFRFCNQRSSSSSSSSGSSSNGSLRGGSSRRKTAANRNKFALAYQQKLLQQQRQSSNVFGRDLIEHTELFSAQDSIPHIVKSCTRFIEKHGIIFGIYRLSGMRANIYKLRKCFDENPKISMIDTETISNDAHAVACVLKQYFRELPTPLLTFHMYEKFIGLFKQSGCNINKDDDDSNIGCNNMENNDKPISNFNDKERESRLDDELAQLAATTTTTTTTVATNTPSTFNNNNNNNIIPTSSNDITTVKSITSNSQTTTTTNTTITTTTTSHGETPKLKQTQLTPSSSDSQLISLSSVVATNTSDLKYQFKLGDLRKLLRQLPKAHYQTLKYLMGHLSRVAATGTRTGMDSKNVAIVWAPNLLKPRELELSAGLETLKILGLQAVITEQLIKHHQFLFDEDDNVRDMNK